MNKMHRQYLPAAVSVLCVFFYFSPWLIGATWACLGLNILSMLWFLFAWIIVVVRLIGFIIRLIKKEAMDKHRILSTLIIIMCYAALMVGLLNNFFVTV